MLSLSLLIVFIFFVIPECLYRESMKIIFQYFSFLSFKGTTTIFFNRYPITKFGYDKKEKTFIIHLSFPQSSWAGIYQTINIFFLPLSSLRAKRSNPVVAVTIIAVQKNCHKPKLRQLYIITYCYKTWCCKRWYVFSRIDEFSKITSHCIVKIILYYNKGEYKWKKYYVKTTQNP